MAWQWYDSEVIRIEQESPNTRRYWLRVRDTEAFHFKAGQFVTLDLPISEKRLKRWRSYSIASPPDGSNVIELCIVHLEGGVGSGYLFDAVHVGTALRFKGPDGAFVLREPLPSELVFVCTGTGVAPFRSIILDLHRSGKPHPPVHLIFGTRNESGILYRSEFEALAREMPGFRYSVALSRQPGWGGAEGYVHPVYMAEYGTARPGVDFYLCGWSNMVDEAVANLFGTAGYDRTRIHYELYG